MTNPNEPAFSSEFVHLTGDPKYDGPSLSGEKPKGFWRGLTKREYFAAMAMQGLLIPNEFQNRNTHWEADVAYNAIRVADALIAELNKEVKP